MKRKYSYTKPIVSTSKEYVTMHDVNIKQIKKGKKGILLVCQDPFTFVKDGKTFYVSDGNVLFEGAESYDCECHAFYGKATSNGEILVGIPVTINELNQYLVQNNYTIEIHEEYYNYSGTLLKGLIRPYQDDLGIDWKYKVIRIMLNTTIKFSGNLQD